MRVAVLRRATSLALLSVFAGLPCGSAFAQATAEAVEAAPGSTCTALIGKSDGKLRVVCGETGFVLGKVTGHTLIPAPAFDATIVDTTFGDDRRVWLVTSGDDGEPILEEITGTLARAAGRGATYDLSGLTLDLAPAAAGRGGAVARRARAGDDVPVELDLAALTNRARTARAAARGAEQ